MNNKPLVLRLREAKENLVAAVNAAIKELDLPCYLLEPIISEVYKQVSASALREYETAKKQTETRTHTPTPETTEGGEEDGRTGA